MTEDREKELFPENAPKAMTKKSRLVMFSVVIVIFASLFIVAKIFSASGDVMSEQMADARNSQVEYAETPQSPPIPEFEKAYAEQRSQKEPEQFIEEEEPAIKTALSTKKERVEKMVREAPEQPEYASNTFRPSTPVKSAKPAKYELPYSVKKRLSSEYQSMVAHYKQRDKWELTESEIQKYTNNNQVASVNPELRELYRGASGLKKGFSFTLSSGSRIIASTNVAVSSDHPREFTAVIERPHELKGQILYCQSGSNVRGRIPVNPIKIIVNEKQEFPITGQVEMEHPGLSGKVTSHWIKRVGPSVANAAIGGAFLAWSMNRSIGEDRVDTRDAITAPIVTSSVQGLQDEVSRLGGDYPNTVDVPSGTNFSVLVSSPITIQGL